MKVISEMCSMGCNAPRKPGRSMCVLCYRKIQLVKVKDYNRRKRNAMADCESCNCGNSACTGLMCDRATA